MVPEDEEPTARAAVHLLSERAAVLAQTGPAVEPGPMGLAGAPRLGLAGSDPCHQMMIQVRCRLWRAREQSIPLERPDRYLPDGRAK